MLAEHFWSPEQWLETVGILNHSDVVGFSSLTLFEEHDVDQKSGAEKNGLHLSVLEMLKKVQWGSGLRFTKLYSHSFLS